MTDIKWTELSKNGQKWPTIQIQMSKFYKIKCCQAFLAVTSSFKSYFLYAYSNFCDIKHLKPYFFSCQLTMINFGVPMQKYVLLSYKCQCCYNYSWFSTKICSGKSHEKIWWYIKKFIFEKIEIKSVRFISNKSLSRVLSGTTPKKA